MFKRLENWWNARTPVWLHNGTKENFAFQIGMTLLIVLGFYAKDKLEERRTRRKYGLEPHAE
jgi:hypothetical protein